jgi:hypothetical protein
MASLVFNWYERRSCSGNRVTGCQSCSSPPALTRDRHPPTAPTKCFNHAPKVCFKHADRCVYARLLSSPPSYRPARPARPLRPAILLPSRPGARRPLRLSPVPHLLASRPSLDRSPAHPRKPRCRFLPPAHDSDYRHSGYSRGHLVPAADVASSEQAVSDSFLLSMSCRKTAH